MTHSKSLMKKLLSAGEGRAAEIMDELLANETVSAALAKAMTRTQAFKAQLDKNVSLALSLVNQPTRDDFDKLRRQLRALDRRVEDLTEQLEKLGKPEAPKKRAPKAEPR